MRVFTVLLFLFANLEVQTVFSQDTIIEYQIFNQQVTEIFPVPVDTSIHFDHTLYSVGILGDQTLLSLTPPVSNLFPGTNFSDIARAELFHQVTDYPIRTAIKLFAWKNGTLEHNCSGILVSENFVLTSAHCLFSPTLQSWLCDSLMAYPAYDNGESNPQLPSSTVEKIYLFKNYYTNQPSDDIALLKLTDPIGQQTGWIGIAFSQDTNYFTGKVFHKLSYPSAPNPINPFLIYNGDTLYYNYGEIDCLGPFLGLNSPNAVGIPGQSGSSLFYTDNQEYYSFGVFSYSSLFRHYQITNNSFFQLKNVILDNPAGIPGSKEQEYTRVYPNPAKNHIQIESSQSFSPYMTVQIMDITGRVMIEVKDLTANMVTIDIGQLTNGMYFIRLQNWKDFHFECRPMIKL